MLKTVPQTYLPEKHGRIKLIPFSTIYQYFTIPKTKFLSRKKAIEEGLLNSF